MLLGGTIPKFANFLGIVEAEDVVVAYNRDSVHRLETNKLSHTKDDTIAGAKFVTLSRRDLLAVQERNTVRHGVQMNLAVVVLEVTVFLHDVLATKTDSSRLLAVQSTDLYAN